MKLTYSPKCRVIIKDPTTGDEMFDVSDDVMSLSTNKAYGRAAGTWQLMLPFKKTDAGYYHQILRPNLVITIEIDAGDGTGFKPVMLGLIDRVSVVRQNADKPVRHVKISGHDGGKLFAKHDIGWDISGVQAQSGNTSLATIEGQVSRSDVVVQSYIARIKLTTGTAASLVSDLMAIFQRSSTNVITKNINLSINTNDDFLMWNPTGVYIEGSSVWEAMEKVSHKPYNMLHCDTHGTEVNSFRLILEENPINASGYLTRTEFHEISDEEIIADDLGASDADMVNLLCYWPIMYRISANEIVNIGMADPDLTQFSGKSIGLNGYRTKVMRDDFVPSNVTTNGDKDAEPKGLQDAIRHAEKYWSWYVDNERLESGTMTLHIRPDIRAGEAIHTKDITNDKLTKEYLVEQVSHQINYGQQPSFTTTLQLTRGQVC